MSELSSMYRATSASVQAAIGATLINYSSDAAVLRAGYASLVGSIRKNH